MNPNSKHPNRGNCYNRTEFNPVEKALADHWESENARAHNVNYGQGILQDLFGEPHPVFGSRIPSFIHVVTPTERWIVATVIQWLGTNCGQSFLQEAFAKAGLKIVRIDTHNRKTHHDNSQH